MKIVDKSDVYGQAARSAQSPIRIVCLGDSLTYGFGVSRRDTWISLAAERTGMEFVNCGINGDTTGGMLARLRDEMTAHSPDRVLIMGGSNDIFISGAAESAKANMSALSHQVVALGAAPLLGTPPPLDVENIRPDWANLADAVHAQTVGDEYAEWLRLFAGVFNIPIVDFRAAFEAASDVKRKRALYIDGLHPTPEGHRLMADVLSAFFRFALS
ncbi:MAG: GDSL-type esterase/lipase family protein [Synergistaceae bacterium]|nr:GDSL-type esterase/lipase family protein [Synergistaceae bacterium]